MSYSELCDWLKERGVFVLVEDVRMLFWVSHPETKMTNRIWEAMSLHNVMYCGSMVSALGVL